MKVNLLPRGFKANAEKLSLSFRSELQIRPTQMLPARVLAKHLDIKVITVSDVVQIVNSGHLPEFCTSQIEKLILHLHEEESKFSAMAASIGEFRFAFVNDKHSLERQESSLMHEMAHIIRNHEGNDLQIGSKFSSRKIHDDLEEEAKILGSILQIPECGLMWFAKNNYPIEAIAERYGASLEMVRFRWGLCGIAKRLNFLSKR